MNKIRQQVFAVLNAQESIQHSKAYYMCDDSIGLDNTDESIQDNFRTKLSELRAKPIELNVGWFER